MKASEMWRQFIAQNKVTENEYEVWAFGDSPDELASLVLKGIKTGTSSAYPLYELEDEDLPKVGEYSVILNAKDEAVCIIQTKSVEVLPFKEITEIYAQKEGEGDKSLRYWKEVHTAFFESCMRESGLVFDEDMLVVFEEFEVVYAGE